MAKQPSMDPRNRMLITMAMASLFRAPMVVSMNMNTEAAAAM